jgi:hypothetical protein
MQQYDRFYLDRRRGLDQREFRLPGPTDERGPPEIGSPRSPGEVQLTGIQDSTDLARAVRTGPGGQQMPTRSGFGEDPRQQISIN